MAVVTDTSTHPDGGQPTLSMEYVLTPEDLREALSWRDPSTRNGFPRALLGWIIFVAIAMVLFVWLKPRQVAAPPGPVLTTTAQSHARAGDPVHDVLLPMVPWVLVFAFVWFFVFRQLRGRYRKAWESTAEYQQTQKLEVCDAGIRIGSVFSETLYRWNAFVGWVETENLMVLRLSQTHRLPIPRRAARDPAEWERFRSAVRANVFESKGGFPVAPKPVLPVQ